MKTKKRGAGNPMVGFMQKMTGIRWRVTYTVTRPDGSQEQQVSTFSTEECAQWAAERMTGDNARKPHALGGFVEHSNVRVESF